MKRLKTYESFDSNISVEDDIKEIMMELEDEGLKVEISFWVKGGRGGFLRSNEKGEWMYGPKPTDDKLYLTVEVKRLRRSGESLFKTEGFNWIDAKSYFDRLRIFLQEHSRVKYKIKNMIFTLSPRFTTNRKYLGQTDKWDTSFDYVDSKYIEKDFTDRNTLTSVSYFFERL